ncbi:hypothetical protein AALO_G00280900 [Alosa alosa]|uniref:Uncharacterized protein n=1 Tax=Alosa alosa TaxID=278164 RepID=A0AAV6FKH8_9TELE|nr:hypothetical protein AALO_G00280900 [Alosa alosa]
MADHVTAVAEQVAAMLPELRGSIVDRKVTIELTNHAETALSHPQVHMSTGQVLDPPPPTIPAKEDSAFSCSRHDSLLQLLYGVITYDVCASNGDPQVWLANHESQFTNQSQSRSSAVVVCGCNQTWSLRLEHASFLYSLSFLWIPSCCLLLKHRLLERLKTRLEQALQRQPLDLDYLEFLCTSELSLVH